MLTPLVLVGHPNHACEVDRKAIDRLAKARHYDASVAAEITLVRLENDIKCAWNLRRSRSARQRALMLLRGYIACAQAVALIAHRSPRLPLHALFGSPRT